MYAIQPCLLILLAEKSRRHHFPIRITYVHSFDDNVSLQQMLLCFNINLTFKFPSKKLHCFITFAPPQISRPFFCLCVKKGASDGGRELFSGEKADKSEKFS
jgi:hypothetical protein